MEKYTIDLSEINYGDMAEIEIKKSPSNSVYLYLNDKESRKLIWQSFSRSMNFDVHLSKKRKEIDEQKKDLEKQIHQFNKLKIVLDLLNL